MTSLVTEEIDKKKKSDKKDFLHGADVYKNKASVFFFIYLFVYVLADWLLSEFDWHFLKWLWESILSCQVYHTKCFHQFTLWAARCTTVFKHSGYCFCLHEGLGGGGGV